MPDYEGLDDYTWGVAPFAKFKLEGHEQYMLIKAYALQLNLLAHPWLRLDPSLITIGAGIMTWTINM